MSARVDAARGWRQGALGRFDSAAESLDDLHWHNAQRLFIERLMPYSGHDGKTVLDFGCDDGRHLAGFAALSREVRLLGIDCIALDAARARLRLHLESGRFALHRGVDDATRLPLEDASVDYIHSARVLHHIDDVGAVLREFRRVLKPEGRARVSVNHYDSIWLHLYVAFVRRVKGADGLLPLDDAFRLSVAGPDCPLARSYTPREFAALAVRAGLRCEHIGNAITVFEMKLMAQHRFDAIEHRNLPREHRDFLRDLTFDERGRPLHQGQVAGLDAVFELRP